MGWERTGCKLTVLDMLKTLVGCQHPKVGRASISVAPLSCHNMSIIKPILMMGHICGVDCVGINLAL